MEPSSTSLPHMERCWGERHDKPQIAFVYFFRFAGRTARLIWSVFFNNFSSKGLFHGPVSPEVRRLCGLNFDVVRRRNIVATFHATMCTIDLKTRLQSVINPRVSSSDFVVLVRRSAVCLAQGVQYDTPVSKSVRGEACREGLALLMNRPC